MNNREKSAQYLRYNWNNCLEFVKTVASFNLKLVSYTEVAKKLGLSAPTAKSFTGKISSCKQYGLITTTGGNTIQLTDTCKRLLFPTGEDTTVIAQTCFSLPPLHSKLIAIYDGKALPNQTILSNILMNDHHIQKSAKDRAAQMFIESAEQLNLLHGGILCYSAQKESIVPAAKPEVSDILAEASAPAIQQEITEIPSPTQTSPPSTTTVTTSCTNESDYISQTIPFESGKIARFSIPIDATEDDLFLLRDMFDVILRRKFKIKFD